MMAIAPYIPSFRPNAIRWTARSLGLRHGDIGRRQRGLWAHARTARHRLDLNDSLRDAGRGTSGSKRDQLTRNLLVTSEIALAVVLVGGQILLMKTTTAVIRQIALVSTWTTSSCLTSVASTKTTIARKMTSPFTTRSYSGAFANCLASNP